jgi:hypothetical protein
MAVYFINKLSFFYLEKMKKMSLKNYINLHIFHLFPSLKCARLLEGNYGMYLIRVHSADLFDILIYMYFFIPKDHRRVMQECPPSSSLSVSLCCCYCLLVVSALLPNSKFGKKTKQNKRKLQQTKNCVGKGGCGEGCWLIAAGA